MAVSYGIEEWEQIVKFEILNTFYFALYLPFKKIKIKIYFAL
jgi:hypothetical protein